MIGNASTFDACTHREPLIPTAWSASSITAYFNQGSFANGSPVYLYVVDSTGTPNAVGKAITISGTYVDATAPYVDNVLPAPSSVGVLETNRTISFDVNDPSNVMTANGAVTIEGVAYTCASGLTCTGNNTPKVHVVYTKGSDWSAGQVVNVIIAGFKDSLGNWTVDGYLDYSYTVRSAPATLSIDTTTLPNGAVGTAYSQPLSISGGTSPYVCTTPSGAWPTGITLSPQCTVSGTPTTSGTFVANAFVTDSLGATDNQDLQIVVAQHQVGGGAVDSSDTYVNINAGTTNYADNTWTEVYTYPVNTVANRILDNSALPTLPANATITSATLRKYMIGTDGAGGDNTMRLYVYPVTGMPSLSLVTWNSFVDNAAVLGASESYADVPKDNGWVSWNVTNMAQAAKAAGTNIFLAIDGSVAVSGATSSADTSRKFASNQNADTTIWPQLIVVYTIGTGPALTSTISAPGKMRVSKMKGVFH